MNDGNIFTGKKPREDALRVLVDVVVAHAVHCTTDVGRVNQLLCLVVNIPGISLILDVLGPSVEGGFAFFDPISLPTPLRPNEVTARSGRGFVSCFRAGKADCAP